MTTSRSPRAWVREDPRTRTNRHSRDTRWQVVYIDPLTRKRRTKAGFKTKAEAEDWRDDFTTQIRSGTYIDPAKASITFGALAQEWHRNTHFDRVRTGDDYRKIIDGERSPTNQHFGNVALADMTHETVAEFIATLSGTRAPQTVRNHYYVIRQVLDYAVRTNRILTNPALGVRLPKQRKPWELEEDRYPLTTQDIHAIITHTPPPYDMYVRLIASTGLRPGEAAAITLADVNLTEGTVHIKAVIVEASGRLHREQYTKTSHSRRTVTLDTTTLALLEKYIRDHQRRALAWFTAHPEHEHPGDALPLWVGGKRGGDTKRPDLDRLDYSKPFRPSTFVKGHWHRAREAAGVPHCTPYSLRHAHASLLVDRIGQPGALTLKEIQDRLGHSSAVMTLDRYAHRSRTKHDEARAALDAALAPTTDNTVVPLRKENRTG